MQNYNSKFQIDIEKRAYLNALDSVKFMEGNPELKLCHSFDLAQDRSESIRFTLGRAPLLSFVGAGIGFPAPKMDEGIPIPSSTGNLGFMRVGKRDSRAFASE